MLKSSLFLLLAVVSVSCGPSADSPTAPSVAQVAGDWRGTTRVSTVSGGECFASDFQLFVGSTRNASAAVTQAGSTLNVAITDPDRGSTCIYTGTTGASAVQFDRDQLQRL